MIKIFRNIFLILAAFLIFSCKNKMSDIKAATEDIVVPLQTNFDAEYRYTEKGELRNILSAKRIDQFGGDSSYIEASGGFTMIFYDSADVEEARLTADHGIFLQKKNELTANKNVVLRNTQGEMLETEKLIFQQDSSRIFTDARVKITSGGGIFYGKGLESNSSFTRYKILEPTGDIYFDDNESSLPSSNGESQ
ncbi:MAG: LPS export ABC transporter periplasmic protein LptC [Flavobacteriales bacterium]|jgi:LPS export ABC transporter protein LptC